MEHDSDSRKSDQLRRKITLRSVVFWTAAASLVLALALTVLALQEIPNRDWLKNSEFAVTFLDRDGTPIGNRGIRYHDTPKIEELPDHLLKATLAAEDPHFYDHFGINISGTFRALVASVRGRGAVDGSSTITQQLAKNLFLSNERTIKRKLREAFLALWLETRLSKNEILKLYFDRAYLGGGAFGVDAAAHFYFNKSARDLNLAESAMLAGMFKSPMKFSPRLNLAVAQARANVVFDKLVEAHLMTEDEVLSARRHPATPIERPDDQSSGYYLDWAFDEVKKLADALPPSAAERVFIVRTALDLKLQHAAETATENVLRQYGGDQRRLQAAAVLADLDGSVRAMVGGRDYAVSQFNRATDAMRQPGPSFVPYVYAAALANGFEPNSTIVDAPFCLGNWCPQNYGRSYAGTVTLAEAMTNSLNTVPVRLSVMLGNGDAKAGRSEIIRTARAMGIKAPLPDTASLPIGADEVQLLNHTVAFAAFPNEGKVVVPHAILEVSMSDGEVVWRFDRDGKKPEQVLSQQVALSMKTMLKGVVENDTGRVAKLDGVPTAGIGGTTASERDSWFVGFAGNFVCGVWMGNDDYSAMKATPTGLLPAVIWHEVMSIAENAPGAPSRQ